MTQAEVEPALSSDQQNQYQAQSLDRQYATLCALGDSKRYKERYLRALEDFKKILSIQGIAEIGIDWSKMSLVVGTECIHAFEENNRRHRLGYYILTMTQYPHSSYKVHNTAPIRIGESETVLAHPHAMQDREFCMTNRSTDIKNAITDGTYSDGLRILMTALYMRRGAVVQGTPYFNGIINWPIEE